MDFKSGDDTAMALDIDTQDDIAAEPATQTKAVAMDKTDKGSDELVQDAAGQALAGAVASAAAASAKDDSKKVLDRRFDETKAAMRCYRIRQGNADRSLPAPG